MEFTLEKFAEMKKNYLEMIVQGTKEAGGLPPHLTLFGSHIDDDEKQAIIHIPIQDELMQPEGKVKLFEKVIPMLAEKVNLCLEYGITPIFCCGEPLAIREAGTQNEFVATQLKESLFHLTAAQLEKIIIAYEPIWAIGTGKTASTAQAQEIHQYLRSVLAGKFGVDVANEIPILYGGSVKAGNAAELFASPDVDGGLVGGASLVAADFIAIIKALK